MGKAFLYGNGSGSGKIGCELIVNAPANVTVSVLKDGKTYSRISDSSGRATFKGLTTGDWTVVISNGTQTATSTITVTADYSATIDFFKATINVTYPAGSTCTATDGITTLTAPDTSGTWACVVPNTGTWTVNATDGTQSTSSNASITADGQTTSMTLTYNLVLVDAANGVYNSGGTSAWDISHKLSGSTFTLTKNTSGEYVLSLKYKSDTAYGNASIAVDTTGRSTLHMKGTLSNGGAHGSYTSSIDLVKTLSDEDSAVTGDLGTGTKAINLNLDISKISGTYYVVIFMASMSGTTATITISELWLE